MKLELLACWLDTIDDYTYKKGKSYYESNRILFIEPSQDGFSAHVEGSGDNVYTASFTPSPGGIRASCSCPVAFRCKHLVAAALYYIAKNPQVKEAPIKEELSYEERQWLNHWDKNLETDEPDLETFLAYQISFSSEKILSRAIEVHQVRLLKKKKNLENHLKKSIYLPVIYNPLSIRYL